MVGQIFDAAGDGVDITDWTALCAFIIAAITTAGLVWQKVLLPMRARTHHAFAHSVVAAIRPELDTIRTQVEAQGVRVDGLADRLLEHLETEGSEIEQINQRQARIEAHLGITEDT